MMNDGGVLFTLINLMGARKLTGLAIASSTLIISLNLSLSPKIPRSTIRKIQRYSSLNCLCYVPPFYLLILRVATLRPIPHAIVLIDR